MKYLTYTSFLLIFVTLIACNKKQERPSDLIDEEVFVQVLTDLHIAETELIIRNISGGQILKLAPSLYRESFDRYKIDKEMFERTFDYYCYHTEEFEPVYEKVIVELSKRQAELLK